MKVRTILDLFYVIPTIFDLEVYFPLAMLLFYLFHYVVPTFPLFLLVF